MAANPFKTQEFQALFREWNQKLKEDGFQDAEDFSLPDAPLKCWHSFRFKINQDHRESYYSFASSLLTNGFKFQSDVARRVWELHCHGKSVRRIEEMLYQQLLGYRGKKKSNVHTIIIEIQRRSGIKR